MTVQTDAGERELGRADAERMRCDAAVCGRGGRNTTTIATLLDAWCSAGDHQLQWGATALPSGIYLARLHGDFGSRATRLTLTR